MDRKVRGIIEKTTIAARRLLEDDISSQLEGVFDITASEQIPSEAGPHLSAIQKRDRERILSSITHKMAYGKSQSEAVNEYIRDAAFTTLNRYAALKMLEARDLVQECITRGDASAGYREFTGLAPAVALLEGESGYRLYIESIFDELSTEVGVLFDRRAPATVLWPKRQTFSELLDLLNVKDLEEIWGEDETIGWIYQFFNTGDERRQMRDESQAPRNSRELAVRNQFFTPRYVVEFLVDNTLGRMWVEMHGQQSKLTTECRYLVDIEGEGDGRQKKDPRSFKILDPACGSGHFLLYAFDLLLHMYEEAWLEDKSPPGPKGTTLREDYPDVAALRAALPTLILEHNLYGVDIDARASQIAALALWMRAQRAFSEQDVLAIDRARVRRINIVVAEPMPEDEALLKDFAQQLDPPLLSELFVSMARRMRLAGELGTLIPVERWITEDITKAREQFADEAAQPASLPGLQRSSSQTGLDLTGIDDEGFFTEAEKQMMQALTSFVESAGGGPGASRRLFAGDAAQGIALIELLRYRFDVVLMNPPFGAMSLGAKRDFEKAYPRTKNDLYAAFVERGVQLVDRGGMVGAITSRTGFFLSSFQKWREEILLGEAPPFVFADLGDGVLDGAMVEVAAYCLERQ